MRRSIADMFRDEGRKVGAVRARRQILLRLLRKRFGELPQTVVNAVEATEDVKQLDAWLERFVTAKTLAQMGIGPSA